MHYIFSFLDFVGGNKLSYVHRDFNSRNLLVKTDKTCVLADFGFAMQVSGLGTAKTDDGPFVAEVFKALDLG